jgi:hypothetical protein
MRSSGKICIWNEENWDDSRWVEILTGYGACELILYDVELDPEIAVRGRIPVDIDMLMAAANGATCEIDKDDFHCMFRREGDWTVFTYDSEDFPFPTEWKLGALWFQSAVWSCVAHRSGGDRPYFL